MLGVFLELGVWCLVFLYPLHPSIPPSLRLHMPKFNYVAMDAHGKETKGTLEVASQNEAIGRVKEMGLFPTKIVELDKAKEKSKDKPEAKAKAPKPKKKGGGMNINIKIPGLSGKVKSKVLTTFTRQLATLVDAGLPLLRGLRVLEKQEKNPTLKNIISELALAIEGGSTFSESLAQHPKVFNRLFVNMVKAGELGGVLEVVLNRLSEFMEKAQKIKGKVIAAMFYPVAVMIVATVILMILMVKVVPSFRQVFEGSLGEGRQLPAFTRLVLDISAAIKDHLLTTLSVVAVVVVLLNIFVSSGVPILQALTIVKETAGNVIISNAVSSVHESVKEGETITAPLEASSIFPPMVISMVDVGEQTGALPEMLLKIADNYDDEVDNAVAAMTSLLEPIMIVFLAIIVGSIVIAMFLPLIDLMNSMGGDSGDNKKGE
jgi:type IV pilus assembly protein PilC